MAISSDDSLKILRVDPRSGSLHLLESQCRASLLHMRFAAGGTQLVGLHTASDAIVTHAFDPATGTLGSPRVVAHAENVSSLLLHVA